MEFYIVTDDQAALLAYEADALDFTKITVSDAETMQANPPAGGTLI